MKSKQVKRRDFFRYLGMGTLGAGVSGLSYGFSSATDKIPNHFHKLIREKIFNTAIIDTHEHLMEESERLGDRLKIGDKINDWTFLFSHYLDSDLLSAGMTDDEYSGFFSRNADPVAKWKIIEPYWPAVKNTGYAQAVRISIRELYGIEEISALTVEKLQKSYLAMLVPGFYRDILQKRANIESCQVNAYPLLKSKMPELLMTDLWADALITQPGNNSYSVEAHINVQSLSDWYRAIDWWFEKYSKYIVGIKISLAYIRRIDFDRVPFEEAEKLLKRNFNGENLTAPERKKIEDNVFWHVVETATRHKLPVKIHLGYDAQWEGKKTTMQLDDVRHNPADACKLCNESKETTFVFFHIAYPYYEEMLAVAKQCPNAIIDMCWVWILNPVAGKDFLKKFIVTVPSNKILTFGGDYSPVEPVLGHSILARNGISIALSELVAEGYLKHQEALELVDVLLNGNARRIFNLEEKKKTLAQLNWNTI